jgi:hypothetical protein
MNLLDLAQKNGRTYKRVSGNNGGEYNGPCPSCGGEIRTAKQISDGDLYPNRFHIWPSQGDHGTFWCRGCNKGGDAIEYLREMEGLSFKAACEQIGKALPEQEEFQKPKFKKPAAETFQPRELAAPSDLWQQHAEKFVDHCHQQLLGNDGPDSALAYLAGRGITRETAIKHRLGWNPGENGKDAYRAREAWGLDTIEKDGKKKKLWLPIGLVIPLYVNNVLRRVRIRIPNERRTEKYSLPYYLVPGSSMDTYVINPAAKAFVVIEAELDAILVDQFAGDLVGSMAMGNSTAKPTAGAYALLENCLHISNALDYDAKTTDDGRYQNAGGTAWLWWKKHFPQAERWPVAVGKDPGDMHKAGVDVREWVKAGLPPAMTLPVPVQKVSPVPSHQSPVPAVQDNSGADVHAVATECGKENSKATAVYSMAAEDGRAFYVTDDQAAYARLVSEGKVVFTMKEIDLIKQLGTDKETARRFLDIKQMFPGISVSEIGPIPEKTEKPQYQRRFYNAK